MKKQNVAHMVRLRRELHMYPELSHQERETRKKLMEFLRAHTALEVVDKGKWFYARYHTDKPGRRPGIAFRADMDAVVVDEANDLPYVSRHPGISHQCGHDGHCATMIGLALEIDQCGAERDVYFLFQHAEETGDGAAECLDDFLREFDVDEVYAYHNMPGYPKGHVVVKDGLFSCASKGMIIEMQGVRAHASMPETGVNPALAIAEIIRSIPALIKASAQKGMTLCTVIQVDIGERAFGVSAGEGKLLLTCRGEYEDEMDGLIASIEKLAEEQATSYGLQCCFSYCDCFPSTVNHKESVEQIYAVCEALGIPVIDMQKPLRTSEDFGHFLKYKKGAMFLFGAGNGPQVHLPTYDFSDDIMEPVVEIFKQLAKANDVTSCCDYSSLITLA